MKFLKKKLFFGLSVGAVLAIFLLLYFRKKAPIAGVVSTVDNALPAAPAA